jgi:hypothetical protein
LAGGPAKAQDAPLPSGLNLIRADRFVTRHGTLSVLPLGRYETGLALDGRVVPGIGNSHVWISGVFALAGEAHDWALVTQSHNGNMCAQTHVLLRLAPDGLRMTAPFGECLPGIADLRVLPGRIEVVMNDGRAGIERVAYAFDGARLTERKLPFAALPVPDGASALRLVGGHAMVPLTDAAERGRFLALMGAAGLEELIGATSGPGPGARQEGALVIGQACRAHECNAVRGFWMIDTGTGKASAGILDGRGLRLWGIAAEAVPASVMVELYAGFG